ncbi:MAG: NADH-quinone oxidoreductase subunit H [Anaerolineales bacterium]
MTAFLQDPFTWIAELLRTWLTGLGLASDFVTFLLQLLGALVLATVMLLLTFLLILGPNRVGPFGVFQTVADLLKLVTKELITPTGADLIPYNLAPLLAVMSVVGLWAVIPLAPTLLGANINVGVLYIISIGAIGTLGIMLAGMSSNNKYALLGAFRTVALMVSYAVPMVLALLVPVLLAGSMDMQTIVDAQSPLPFLLLTPVAAFVFFISSLAEVGRAPFDLLEAESEIVAGFHIEYSGLKFGMFFVAEFLHAFTISAITATLFLGGWQGPWAEQYPFLGLIYFLIKTSIVYFVVIWIRGSFPRIRIDQMNAFNWKFITPVALLSLSMSAVAEKLAVELGWSRLLVHLAASGFIVLITLVALGIYARTTRRRSEQMPTASESLTSA